MIENILIKFKFPDCVKHQIEDGNIFIYIHIQIQL